jgi:hypothetical protein
LVLFADGPPVLLTMLQRVAITDHELDDLRVEFPTIAFEREVDGAPVIDGEHWAEATSFAPFDRLAERAGGAIAIRGSAKTALEVLTRYQRFIERRNVSSNDATFSTVLAAHRAIHDTTKPLVKADLDHALDTWQWMLRLEPSATAAAQLAALFHDIERLESEADARIEHRATDYQAFKDAHAATGAARTHTMLLALGVATDIALETRNLVANHERRRGNRQIDLLNDADALSFFSLNSAGYVDYFGPEQTKQKMRYTLGRLSLRARQRLPGVRLRPDVRALLAEVA